MAKRKTSSRGGGGGIVRAIQVHQPRAAAPIINVRAPAAPKKKGGGRRRRGRGGGASAAGGTQKLMATLAGGFAFGWIEKNWGASLPTLPVIGRAGTITILAHLAAKQGFRFAHDVAVAGSAISGYQLGNTGRIAGEEDDGYSHVAPQVRGVAAQV